MTDKQRRINSAAAYHEMLSKAIKEHQSNHWWEFTKNIPLRNKIRWIQHQLMLLRKQQ